MERFNISNFNQLKKDKIERVAALGFFDGVHFAHKKIIEAAVVSAKEQGKRAVVITLDRSPKEYFGKTTVDCLTPLCKKTQLFSELGIDEVYYLKFNETLQNLSAEQFINKILSPLNIVEVFCGYDYKFGYKGQGTAEFIESYSLGKIKANILQEEKLNDIKISTTVLKEFVEKGKFENYIDYATRPYSIKGIVVKGRQLGRTINFPTANLKMDFPYLLPQMNGVYLTKTFVLGKMYKSLTNIGYNPTVSENNDKRFIETYILDFDKDIYDEEIEIYFYKSLREEKKFNSFDELKEQLQKDKKLAEEINI